MSNLRTRMVSLESLTPGDLSAWEGLEAVATDPNAYLSPHFVLPAARHLSSRRPPRVVLAERPGPDGATLVGLAVVQPSWGSKRIPSPHNVVYRTKHSFLSGLLLHRDCATDALTALLEGLKSSGFHGHGLALETVWTDSLLAQAAEQHGPKAGRAVRQADVRQRAILYPELASAQLQQPALRQRVRELDRKMRRLREVGQVEWRCHRGQVPEAAVEAFLALEHAGWKGESGSSLRSCNAEESFFREAVARFSAAGRALFTELCLDGVPIASSSNFIAGRTGFGFKVGYDPRYRAYAPGLLNELGLLRHAGECLADLDCIDSGSNPGAYIEQMWLSRRPVTRLAIPLTPVGRIAVMAGTAVRAARRSLTTTAVTAAAPAADAATLAEAALLM